jgi:hypothetical protein
MVFGLVGLGLFFSVKLYVSVPLWFSLTELRALPGVIAAGAFRRCGRHESIRWWR